MDIHPDLTERPHDIVVEQTVALPPDVIYKAWTEDFDAWFAQQGTLSMKPEVGSLYFFETHFEGGRHPHYGRFLKLVPGELIEMTWVTGNPGTMGAETVLTLELSAAGDDTDVRLSHRGFYDRKTAKGHAQAWPLALEHLEKSIKGSEGG